MSCNLKWKLICLKTILDGSIWFLAPSKLACDAIVTPLGSKECGCAPGCRTRIHQQNRHLYPYPAPDGVYRGCTGGIPA
ncbi:hypothetical protein PGT21_021499 [Puccinia graminis f. sp. tritici]|uniref:Secreted protein n=1 Tax=Puccinia graminis f. sp. tritici TaxID=56615 RepID=A0A5B0NQX6_PUCGR|nr:hypothetical protein PGTUg99_022336 [Puccinia graminis f. sp. tritici]KAA1066997.1 hypothetical protein PGTUg99_023994 [Puccinia graminis f. sp. tritici]KAA1083884.1 hypothetical protein PGT21_010436 [Puccinia graminis f. sp. tritici]KAA1090278.1 hypothetical protein PGTUg99_001078 [Puccinia graminis f. sp. tritici]KAA1119303.1 hypothetical protein PGT21_021499 [Puccinia graminis f. sp. tritici]